MIEIDKSPTADTRTCNWSEVTKLQLLESSAHHLNDVRKGLEFFVGLLMEAATKHDLDKIRDLDDFHRDFATGFKQTEWWDNHRRVTRHHISEISGIPDDVNFVDVIEYIVDYVMAGMARSGNVCDLELSSELLQKAFQNTVQLLKNNTCVAP